METPSTRSEFERHFYLLVEGIKRGRIHFPMDAALGLTKVRRLPNGRIDLLSIDELTRMEANMAAQSFPEVLKTYSAQSSDQVAETSAGADDNLDEGP